MPGKQRSGPCVEEEAAASERQELVRRANSSRPSRATVCVQMCYAQAAPQVESLRRAPPITDIPRRTSQVVEEVIVVQDTLGTP